MDEITIEGKQYVSLARAAAETEYDREYLRKLVKAGKIAGVQIGGQTWMINIASIHAYTKEKPQRKPHEK